MFIHIVHLFPSHLIYFLTPINCHAFASEMGLQQLLDGKDFGCEGMCFQLLPFLVACTSVKQKPRGHMPQRIRAVFLWAVCMYVFFQCLQSILI